MEFHEYKLTKQCNPDKSIESMSINDYYMMFAARVKNGWDPGDIGSLMMTELAFVQDKRPFYNVYPAVVSCLENTRLGFKLNQIECLGEVIAICFAVGKEPVISNGKIASMLVELVHSTFDLTTKTKTDVPMMRLVLDRISDDGKRHFSSIVYQMDGLLSDVADKLGDKKKLLSLAVGVLMLAQDERFVEPILLNRDQGKKLDAEGTKKAIERAKNRGRNGKSIGKYLDVSPHMRKPHFATRWTGKGGQIPRLVPVKGCLVSRSKLYPVPTGYMDE